MESELAQQQFLECLRGFLLETEPESCLGEGTEPEWRDLFLLARAHRVVPMVYESLGRMEEFAHRPEEYRRTFRRCAAADMMWQTEKNKELVRICEKIYGEEIPCLVLKGMVCRELYSHPAHRTSGDEDLLVHPADRGRLHKLLLKEGYCQEKEEQEEALVWTYLHRESGLHLEIHRGLFDQSPYSEGMNAVFAGIFERTRILETEGGRFWAMGCTDQLLYLLLHDLKHFSSVGLGIRQICDTLQFARKHGKEVDWQLISRQMEELGIGRFAEALFLLGERVLGISVWELGYPGEKQEETDTAPLLSDVLEGGVYGKSSEARIESSGYTVPFVRGDRKRGLAWTVWQRLFPQSRYLAGRYPVLRSRPWLLPVFWMVRIGVHLARIKGKQRGEILAGIEVGRRRMKLLEYYGVPGWQTERRQG